MSMILLFQLETRELEMVAASEIKAKEREKENELMVNDIDQLEEGKSVQFLIFVIMQFCF